MGYLDRVKALMKEAGSEVKGGIDGTKSVLSVKTYPETKPLVECYRLEYPDDLPEYPHQPCQCGNGDYWLREASQWGKAEWLCSRCHPKLKGGEQC